MPRAWRIMYVTVGLFIFTGCSGTIASTSDSVNQSNSISESVNDSDNAIDDKIYTEISFNSIPEDILSEYNDDIVDVSIVGYLSDSISNDKSTAYLFNSGYGTTPEDITVGKCVVLDMSNITLSDSMHGDEFVTVKGTIIKDNWVNIYNTKSAWYLKVDKIESLITLPNNVREYQEYMESDEFEAFAKLIDFVGTAVYTWYNDDSVVELDLNDIGCNTTELSKCTKEKYPKLYEIICEYEDNLSEYYNDIVGYLDNGTRPKDIQYYYDGLYNNYSKLTDALVDYGMINNGG